MVWLSSVVAESFSLCQLAIGMARITDRLAPEFLIAMDQNGRSASARIPDRHGPEYAATYAKDEIPPFTVTGRQRELTRRLLAEKCECCGTTGMPLEAHHTNKLANLKRRWQGRKHKPAWVKWMISRHRKTIFVCQACHQDITYGRYDGAKVC
jgi:hypothetical protein